MNPDNKFREIRFDEPFDDQDWLDIGADLRIKIRKQFYQLKKQIEQLKAENNQLKSKLAKAKETLNTALNYLHWREDDLIGYDFKGDGKLTERYKNRVSEIEKSISEIGEG